MTSQSPKEWHLFDSHGPTEHPPTMSGETKCGGEGAPGTAQNHYIHGTRVTVLFVFEIRFKQCNIIIKKRVEGTEAWRTPPLSIQGISTSFFITTCETSALSK